MKKSRLILFGSISLLLTCSCSKLNENAEGNLTAPQLRQDSIAAAQLLRGVYYSLEATFTCFEEVFALSELSTDEAIAPTRGTNWDDNGVWRVLHEHKWDGGNIPLNNCFNNLSGVIFSATNLLQYKATKGQQAEARFLRAWAMYWLLDFFNQVPYREPGESVLTPAKVRVGMDALNFIISEVYAIEPNLVEGPAGEANKYGAKALLMKCYLNKGVYANRAAPSFALADMDSVIKFADEIINSNQFSFSENYFDNFSPLNSSLGNENIYTQASSSDGNYELCFSWGIPLSYAQGGFNGFTTLSDFYNRFDSTDNRRQAVYDYPNAPLNPGRHVNLGFLIGQQYDLNSGSPLYFNGSPVILTPNVQNILQGTDLFNSGIRPIKYAPDYLNFYGPAPTNSFVYFRLPDVLLMKAEAILRGGAPTNEGSYGNTALSLVNAIRTDPSRGVKPLTSLSPDDLYDERGRELWWECWRRQDMIRFGKFHLPFEEKQYIDDPKYLLYPIPYDQISVNKNYKQNPGYN